MHRIEGENNDNGSFTDGPPGTTVDANWLNSIQEELINILTAVGKAPLTAANDTKNQLALAILTLAQPYSVVVQSQLDFVNMFERTGANAYKIKDTTKSVYLKNNLTGGFQLNQVLSNGDLWGAFSTNNCAEFIMEASAYIDVSTSVSYLNVTTDDCKLTNVDIRGDKTSATAIARSFLLNANRVTFENCKTSARSSSATVTGFEGSATAAHNDSSNYNGCQVYNFTSTGEVRGFDTCDNMTRCMVTDIDGVTVSAVEDCDNISNMVVKQLDSSTGGCVAFENCNNLNACNVEDLDSTLSSVEGFNQCSQLSSCRVITITSLASTAIGFRDCNNLSACRSSGMTATNGGAQGYNSCIQISACIADDIDTTDAQSAFGFASCQQISACKATGVTSATGTAAGFSSCVHISSCYSTVITGGANAFGYTTCTYGAALNTDEALNNGSNFMDTTDANIAKKFSTMETTWT